MNIKTALYMTHRWLGIGMSLFFAMWFFTGVVMMYVGFPELTEDERYSGLSAIEPEKIAISPSSFLNNLAHEPSPPFSDFVLTTIADRPAYLARSNAYSWLGMYADSAELFAKFSAEDITASALSFYNNQRPERTLNATYAGVIELDQWTVSSGLNIHRPLHLVTFDDESKTHFYVSSLTGQVVRDTAQYERVWNWLGANLHWIYPVVLRKHGELWANTIILISVLGLFSVMTGAIIGFQRLRMRRPYRQNSGQGDKRSSYSPYRGMDKYHHIVGLLSLIFLCTYMFSGLMSMSPWGLFDAEKPFSEQAQRYAMKENIALSDLAFTDLNQLKTLLDTQGEHAPVKQVSWHAIQGRSYLSLHRAPYDVEPVMQARPREQIQQTNTAFFSQSIADAYSALIPDAEIESISRLEEYDAYYYSHHNRFRPLPILRVKYADDESTWFHIDLSTAQLIGRLTYKDRIYRWLYNGLHSLDFGFLINSRPLWDTVVIALCSIGFLFSITSIVIAWRYLKKLGRKNIKRYQSL